MDFAGPFRGKMFLILVDAHSKWPEVVEMGTTSAAKTIEVLRQIFAAYGLPEQLVSDNGSQFTSEEFAKFTKANGIKHICITPYHPSSNGLAERFVQTFKRAMKTGEHDCKSFQHRLSNFLLTYRSAPHATTNQTPCSLFLKREVRTRFDLMRPDSESQVSAKQALQKLAHDSHAKNRELTVGQEVMARNYRDGDKWMPGTVVERKSPLSYTVQMESGTLWRRHIDQLREHAGTATRTDGIPITPEQEEVSACNVGDAQPSMAPVETADPETAEPETAEPENNEPHADA